MIPIYNIHLFYYIGVFDYTTTILNKHTTLTPKNT